MFFNLLAEKYWSYKLQQHQVMSVRILISKQALFCCQAFSPSNDFVECCESGQLCWVTKEKRKFAVSKHMKRMMGSNYFPGTSSVGLWITLEARAAASWDLFSEALNRDIWTLHQEATWHQTCPQKRTEAAISANGTARYPVQREKTWVFCNVQESGCLL